MTAGSVIAGIGVGVGGAASDGDDSTRPDFNVTVEREFGVGFTVPGAVTTAGAGGGACIDGVGCGVRTGDVCGACTAGLGAGFGAAAAGLGFLFTTVGFATFLSEPDAFASGLLVASLVEFEGREASSSSVHEGGGSSGSGPKVKTGSGFGSDCSSRSGDVALGVSVSLDRFVDSTSAS